MNLDFTHAKYGKFCNSIVNSSYLTLTVEKCLSEEVRGKVIILRHDVDAKIENSLKVAKMEEKAGLISTYYIRMNQKVFKPAIIREIESLGHEIGYHYEVLDKAKGDYENAIEIFKNELAKFRKICDIKTICMHGNSRTKWDNRDLWKYYDFKEFDIIGEAYLSIDYSDVVYFSDTGRTWRGNKYRVKDFVSGGSNSFDIKSTDELIELINEERIERMCILSHPGQWNDSYSSWIRTWAIRNVKNFIKANVIRKRYR